MKAEYQTEFSQTFTHHTTEVNGVQLHYVMAGKGEAIVLLHGWPQTWYEWRKIIPILAKSYTVIAPDMRGLGDSSKPDSGYDKRTAAEDIYQLVNFLGFKQINLVGHDIGGMVAYAFAAMHPEAVRRLVLMEFWLPGFGLEDGMDVAKGGLWHFGFHMTSKIPEMLTQGREREYLSTVAYKSGYNPTAITEADIDEYVRHYASPGGMRAGFEYYRTLLQDGQQNQESAKSKLLFPVLVLTGSDSGIGDRLLKGVQAVAENVQSGVIEQSGHWLAEEQPAALSERLLAFFNEKAE